MEIALDGGDPRPAELARRGDHATAWIDGRAHRCGLLPLGDGHELTLDDRRERIHVVAAGDRVFVHAFGRAWELSVTDPVERARRAAEESDVATAPMPGTVVSIAVGEGDAVGVGQPLVVIESMKMHSEIVATRDGTVERVFVAVGDSFDRGARLVGLAEA